MVRHIFKQIIGQLFAMLLPQNLQAWHHQVAFASTSARIKHQEQGVQRCPRQRTAAPGVGSSRSEHRPLSFSVYRVALCCSVVAATAATTYLSRKPGDRVALCVFAFVFASLSLSLSVSVCVCVCLHVCACSFDGFARVLRKKMEEKFSA